MKITTIIFIFSFIFSLNIYSQNRSLVNDQTGVFIINGECYKVINTLRTEFKNDSIAVDFFLKNYEISGSTNLFKKGTSPSIIIKYFSRAENKNKFCVYKRIYMDKVLLDTSKRSH